MATKGKRKVHKQPARKAAPRAKAARIQPAKRGLIRGMHGMFYSSQADALRLFLRDKVGRAAPTSAAAGSSSTRPKRISASIRPRAPSRSPAPRTSRSTATTSTPRCAR